jgi:membrane protease YdiL (CAAX protease family)
MWCSAASAWGRVTTVHPTGASTSRARPRQVGRGLLATITVLVVSNVVSNRVWPQAYVPWNLAVAALLLIIARRAGVTCGDLGLTRRRLRPGLVAGCVVACSVAGLYLTALLLLGTRAVFLDARAAGPLSTALFAAFVRIPLGTVVLEEVAFRGVLPALVSGSWWRATLVSSALFGLWHVLPAAGLASANAAVGATFGGWGAAGQAGLAVLSAFVAGVLLCVLRRWSGHLVTPMLAHLATNSLGVLLAWWTVSVAA